jgi:hypothetical protein
LSDKAAPLPALQPPSTRDPLRFDKLPVKVAVSLINAEFFVLRSSGRIYRDDDDGELKAIPKPDFGTALAGRVVEIVDTDGNTKTKPAAVAWIESPDSREYIGVQYCPEGRGLKSNYKNLWDGWGLSAGDGDCSIVLDHVLQIVAGGNRAKADVLLRWMADILQNPTRKPGVCVVLRGSQGCGKSVIAALLRKVLGPKNVLVTSEKNRILGRFNAPVANKILLVGEEMLFAGDRATTDKLKHLITGDSIQIEMKFGDQIDINSCHRLLLTSNHQQVIQAASDERRFVIFDVSDANGATLIILTDFMRCQMAAIMRQPSPL